MIALITEAGTTPPGSCPVCGGIMDTTGCRLGQQWTSGDLHASGGVERVLDVYCAAVPAVPETPTAAQVGAAVRALREGLGLSLVKAAGRANMAPVRFRDIEIGAVEATDREHKNILRALGFVVIDA